SATANVGPKPATQQTSREFGPQSTAPPTAPMPEGTTPTQPSATAPVLNQGAPRAATSSTGGPEEKMKEPPLSLAADTATNTLLAIGEPRLLAQLDLLVRRLDVRQPEVMLEVMVVTLNESETLDLGVEL